MTTMLKQQQVHKFAFAAGFAGLFVVPAIDSKPVAGIWFPGQDPIATKNRRTSLARGGGSGS